MEIKKGDFLGTISKTFGKNGEILLKFNPDYFEVLKNLESVLIEIDKKPVPFFISDIHLRNNKSAIITFYNYSNTEIMEEFVGCNVFIKNNLAIEIDNPILPYNINGFKIIDKQIGELGIVTDIIEYSKNTVLQVSKGNIEILIPFNIELIVNADKRKKTIHIILPEGLLDLNN